SGDAVAHRQTEVESAQLRVLEKGLPCPDFQLQVVAQGRRVGGMKRSCRNEQQPGQRENPWTAEAAPRARRGGATVGAADVRRSHECYRLGEGPRSCGTAPWEGLGRAGRTPATDPYHSDVRVGQRKSRVQWQTADRGTRRSADAAWENRAAFA